jgi:hypothetical protein
VPSSESMDEFELGNKEKKRMDAHEVYDAS